MQQSASPKKEPIWSELEQLQGQKLAGSHWCFLLLSQCFWGTNCPFWLCWFGGYVCLCCVPLSCSCSSPWTCLMSLCLPLPSKTCIWKDNSCFLPLLKGRKVLGPRQVKAMHFRGVMNLRHVCISSSEPGAETCRCSARRYGVPV